MRKLRSFALLVVLLAVSVSAMAQRAFDVNLWDAKTPNKTDCRTLPTSRFSCPMPSVPLVAPW